MTRIFHFIIFSNGVQSLRIWMMEDFVPETPCCVGDCNKNAIYKCPRCELFYCSVACYRCHSKTCVKEFSQQATRQLRGQRVSEDERKRFNMLLHRNKTDSGEVPDFFVEQTDTPQVPEPNISLSSESESESESDGGDAATLLTSLMDELSDEGKNALFTALHKAMIDNSNRQEKRAARGRRSMMSQSTTNYDGPSERVGVANRDLPGEKTKKFQNSSLQTTLMQRDRENCSDKVVENDEDIAETLQDVLDDLDHGLIDCEQALSRLPPTLADDFQSRVRDGRLGDLVKVWQPWWTNGNDENDDHDESAIATLPERPNEDLLSVATESARRIAAHNSVLNGVCNVLVSYCFMQRSMNGDWRGDCLTSGRKLWENSVVLGSDGRPTSIEESVRAAYGAIMSEGQTRIMGLQAVRDVATILGGGRDWVSRSLYDAANVLRAVIDEKECKLHKIVRRGVKKLHFYTAWALGEDSECFIRTARSVASLAERMDFAPTETSVARKVRFMLDETGMKQATDWL